MLVDMEDIVGAAEIGDMLGVSRQRVQQIVTRADFPAPAKVLAMGKIWLAAEVRAWIRDHRTVVTDQPESAPRRPAKRTARDRMGSPEGRASKAMRRHDVPPGT